MNTPTTRKQYWMLIDSNKITRKKSMQYRHVRERMDDYFKLCLVHSKMEDGIRPTLTGLAFHMGFNSLEHMKRVEKDSKFTALIQKGRTLVENYYESTGSVFAMFALKQLGWTDQLVIEQNTTTLSEVIVTINKGGKRSRIKEGIVIPIDPPKRALGSK